MDSNSTKFAQAALSRRAFLGGVTAAGAVLGAGSFAGCSGAQAPAISPGGTVKSGGTFTVGITGGRPTDTLDPNSGGINDPQNARLNLLYNALVVLDADANIRFDLAESITPNTDATKWIIKLRSGVTFHNGKPLTADDVIFTLRRILDPAKPLNAKASLGPVDLKKITKIDDLSVRLPMTRPYATLIEQMATYYYFLFIAPVGFDVTKPVGTGPFMYESFTPARQSTFVKNPNYWKPDRPYLDKVVITDFAQASAAANALVSRQLNATVTVTPTDLLSFSNNPNIKILRSESGAMTPFTMRVDQAPLNDVRVRQAMRLIVDRPKLIASAMGGQGTVGNDVFSPYDPCYDPSLQRQQDIPQAKALLKAAGRDGMAIQLTTTNVHQFAEQAQVFAQNAQAAGVTVTLNQLDNATYYGPQYHNWLFAHQYWLYNPYLPQVAQATLPKVPGSSTHFSNQKYVSLYNEANAMLDKDKRCELSREMMKIDFEEGGYIIPAFLVVNDAYASNVLGLKPSKIGLSLGNYSFEDISLA